MGDLFHQDAAFGYARVAVERGIDRYPDGLTYAVPAELEGLAAGERVMVPLGRGDRDTAGYVVEVIPSTDIAWDRIKFIVRRDAAATRLPLGLMRLARWISTYYCAPIGMTLSNMLPAAVKRNVGVVTRLLIDLADGASPPPRMSAKQKAVLDVLAATPPEERPIDIDELARRSGLKTRGPVRRLIEAGLLDVSRRSQVEAAWAQQARPEPVPEELTEAQRQVVDAVSADLGRGFSAHLLYGVTGSGKTEVYIRLIEQVVQAGRVALVLVPEISLTPQTGGRLVTRFPHHRVAILHSGLTAAQRHQQWAFAAEGASIVLGARSAVFAPIADERLGIVIVDEEHDGSYKQDQTPRYHGRDVALKRAQLAGCPVVLGSATPSCESWHNATGRGIYRLHRLEERVPGLRLPAVTIVDFAEEQRKHHDRRVHLLGPVLEDALSRTLADGGQALLLLNRRGYANYIACPDHMCGWVMNCDYCDVTVVYHKSEDLPTGGFVQCHHCLSEQRLPPACPDCGRHVTVFGLGTQRVEEELSRKLPALVSGRTMMRVDSDTMRSARDLHEVLDRFARGDLRVLLGTQMIAKGLDYPGVRLVGVINADTAMHLPDFRAAERTFQLVSQVAGRCGRSSDSAARDRVVVQSFNPTTPALTLAAAHDYPSFAALELAERARCGLPPYSRMARLVVRDEDLLACQQAAADLATGLRDLAAAPIRIRGPAPCPIARLSGRHRQQVEVLAPDAATLQHLLTAARNLGLVHAGAALAVDVDPTAMM